MMEDKLGGGNPKIGGNLRMKCTRGGIMVGLGTALEHGLRFVSWMILTRLLAPEHLGLMGIVVAVSLGCEAFTDVGIKQAVIQNRKGARLEYLNVAWWFQAVRSVGLYLVAFLLTPYLCNFYFAGNQELLALYAKPEILRLFRVAFLMIVFRGLMSPRAYVLEKEFRFGKVVLLMQGSNVVATLLTIVLAFCLKNIWALVIGYTASGIIPCFFSYLLCPFLPRLKIDRVDLRELMRFARGMFGLPILSFIAFQTDLIVVGKLMPIASVGMYTMAIKLSQMPRTLVGKSIAPVLLPAFAEKQDNKKALCSAVLRMTRVAVFIGLPFVVFMSAYAQTILSVVYGPTYAKVAIAFGILAFCMLLKIQGVVLASVYVGIGQPHLHRRCTMLFALIIVGLIYPGIKLFGLAGSASVVLCANVVALLAQIMWLRKPIGLNLKDYLSVWLPGFYLASVVLVPAVLLSIFKVTSMWLDLVVGFFTLVIVGVVFLFSVASWKYVGTSGSRLRWDKLEA